MKKPAAPRILLRITRISWRDLFATSVPVVLASVIAIAVAYRFVQPAPPDTITMTSGPAGSSLRMVAERYRPILARNGIRLEIIPSSGSLQNLERLIDPKGEVDVGFVQGGLAASVDNASSVVSLGSLFNQPLAILYRAPRPIERLSELQGKRVAIGPEGSGTRFLSLALLKANEIEPKGTKLLELAGDDAAEALIKGQIDAAFLTGDSAAGRTIGRLLRTKGIRLFDFPQADAYLRRFRYLNKLEFPAGSFDLGENLPAKPLVMLAPTVELIARADLHPALSDLMIEAAQQVHGRANILQRAGEFPAPLEHEYPISEDAARYYKSGKTFAYRHLPFWLASLTDRVLVMLVPIAIVLIPGLRFLPSLYNWRVRRRIFRRYGELMALERAALAPVLSAEERAALLVRLDEIEKGVIASKIPDSFADQTYILREHIAFARARLMGGKAPAGPA